MWNIVPDWATGGRVALSAAVAVAVATFGVAAMSRHSPAVDHAGTGVQPLAAGLDSIDEPDRPEQPAADTGDAPPPPLVVVVGIDDAANRTPDRAAVGTLDPQPPATTASIVAGSQTADRSTVTGSSTSSTTAITAATQLTGATASSPAGSKPAADTGATQMRSKTRFETLPPGSALPDGRRCAALVRPVAENVPENEPYNRRRGTAVVGRTDLGGNPAIAGNDYEARIDGDFVGTTDEIIQWGACKWGFDEDHVRAQAYAESSWFAGQLGDCGEKAQPRTGGDGGCTSVGLLQVRSAGLPTTFHPGLWPSAWESTAMNVDYALAVKRLCYEGRESWLADVADDGVDYRAGDEWGCMGRWFSGDWYDGGAKGYIESIRALVRERKWETRFVGCPAWRDNFYCSDGAGRGF